MTVSCLLLQITKNPIKFSMTTSTVGSSIEWEETVWKYVFI